MKPLNIQSTSDFDVLNGGSVILFRPVTDRAVEWVDEHIGTDNGYQPYYPTFISEPRYVEDIIRGIRGDGLSLELL